MPYTTSFILPFPDVWIIVFPAFTYFIANGYSLYDSIHYASITSAISVTRIGSRNSIPMLSEVLDYENAIW